MSGDFRDPAALLALGPPMMLLDEIVWSGQDALCAAVEVAADRPYCHAAGAPGWVGLEWLAQAAGAWFGIRQRQRGEPVEMGFLLGTRRYRGPDQFEPGRFHATVRLVLFEEDTGIAVMDGTVGRDARGGGELAASRIKLFKPSDLESFLAARMDEIT